MVLLQPSFVHQSVELQDQVVVIPQVVDQALLLLPAEHEFTVELSQDHGVPQDCVYQSAWEQAAHPFDAGVEML